MGAGRSVAGTSERNDTRQVTEEAPPGWTVLYSSVVHPYDAVSTLVVQQALLLAGWGAPVAVVTLDCARVVREALAASGVRVFEWPRERAFALEAMRLASISIFHFAGYTTLSILWPLLRGNLVVWNHNFTPQSIESGEVSVRAEESLRELIAARPACVVSDSWFTRDAFTAMFDTAAQEVCPLPLRPEFVRHHQTRAGVSSQGGTRRSAAFVGRLTYAKGADRLIAYSDFLLGNGFTVDWMLSPSSASEWEQIARNELGDRVQIRIGVSTVALLDTMSRCSVLLQPSRHEGLGLPVLEGLVAGCIPVVPTDYAHRSELRIGELGIEVDWDRPETWASSLASILGLIGGGRERREALDSDWARVRNEVVGPYMGDEHERTLHRLTISQGLKDGISCQGPPIAAEAEHE